MKKELMLLIGILFGVLLIIYVNSLSIDFVGPTPADGASNSSIIINISTDQTGDHYIFTDWQNSTLGWWMFDYYTSNGLTIYDNSTKNNHATNVSSFNASTDLVTGYWGLGWNTTKSVGYFNLSNIPKNTFTISFWIKADAVPGVETFVLDPSAGYPYISHRTTGYIMMRYSSADYIMTAASIGTAWHHIVIQLSTSGQSGTLIYTDGVSGVSNLGTAGGPYTFAYSNYNLGRTFNGTIDDVIVFNRTLSQAEVSSLYNASANKYSVNFTNLTSVGNNYSYKSFIVNSSGSVNSTALRTFGVNKELTNLRPYNNRNYLSPISFNISTNFNASCIYSLNLGVANLSLSSANNRNFNATNSSIAVGSYTIDFWCNDSTDILHQQSNFSIVNNLTYYVNKSASACSNSIDKNYATNETTPFCNISSAIALASAGDEIVVKYGDYCEGINIGNSGINGTLENSITIRGESDSQRTILNGTCSNSVTYSNGISLSGEDFWTVKYFYITNFSYDGFNVHASGADNSIGILFQNSTIYDTGYSASGDGVSYHENCSGTNEWIIINKTSKMGIVDINNAVTNYSNIYMYDIDNEGVFFTDTLNNLGVHYLEDIFVYNSNANCVDIDKHTVHINRLYCEGSYFDEAIYLRYNSNLTINITNFRLYDIDRDANDFYSQNNQGNLFLSNGQINNNSVKFINSSANLINITYLNNVTEIIDSNSNLSRYWYLDISSNINNTNITLKNSTGSIIYSNLTNGSISQQTLLSYNNIGGTKTYYSNYTLTASVSGYFNQTIIVNLTDNNITSFILIESVAPSLTINSPSSGQAFTTASVLLNVTLNENGTCLYSTNAGTTNISMDTTDNLTFTKTGSFTDGTNTINFYCNDTSGNRNDTTSVSFSVDTSTVNPDSGGGGSSGGGEIWTVTYTPTETQVISGYSNLLGEKYRFNFKLYNEVHNLGIINLTAKNVTIKIFSNVTEDTLVIGEVKKYNLTNSEYYNLYVKLNSIANNKANITIKQIWEKIDNNIYVSECQTLTQENKIYILNKSLSGTQVTANCINIISNNITFDCNYNSIKNSNLQAAIIYIIGNNNSVKNCDLQASYYKPWNAGNGNGAGILMFGNNNRIKNNRVRNSFWGINLYSSNNIIENNILQGNSKGIHFEKNNNIAKNNLVSYNNKNQGWGLGVWRGQGNQFINNKVYSNNYGISIYQGDNTLLKCNSFSLDRSYDIYLFGAPWYFPIGQESNKNITAYNNTYSKKYIGRGAEFIEQTGNCDVECSWASNSCIDNRWLTEFPMISGSEKSWILNLRNYLYIIIIFIVLIIILLILWLIFFKKHKKEKWLVFKRHRR